MTSLFAPAQTRNVETLRDLHLLRFLGGCSLALVGRSRAGLLVLTRHDQRHVVNLVRVHKVLLLFLEDLQTQTNTRHITCRDVNNDVTHV